MHKQPILKVKLVPIISFSHLLTYLLTYSPGTIAVAPSDIGAFARSAFLPLILTDPYAASIKERLKIENLMIEDAQASASSEGDDAKEKKENELKKLWLLQRKARAQIVASHVKNMEQYNQVLVLISCLVFTHSLTHFDCLEIQFILSGFRDCNYYSCNAFER